MIILQVFIIPLHDLDTDVFFFIVSDVTVHYKDGLPVVTLPLPSRRETCEFTLKPISHTVGDFVKFIKDEDGGIDIVTFFTKGQEEYA